MIGAAYADSEVCQASTRRPHFRESVMNVHYSITAELGRQRQQQIARSVETCRSLTPSRRRWWEPGFLRHTTKASSVQAPTPGWVSATA